MRKKLTILFILLLLFITSYKIYSLKKAPPSTSVENLQLNSDLSTEEKNWFYVPKNDGTPSEPAKDSGDFLQKYSGYFLGDTSKKVLYLTFDEGYENGYTSKILDVLKDNNVKAAFFVTTTYIKAEPDLIKRMFNEGHLVCNHSTTHPSMAKITDKDKFAEEINLCQNAYENITAAKMPKFFRPPMGKYSELSLNYTKELGYKTIFGVLPMQIGFKTNNPVKNMQKISL